MPRPPEPSLVGTLASALRAGRTGDARMLPDAAALLEREVEELTAQALTRLKQQAAVASQTTPTTAALPPPPPTQQLLLLPLLPRRALFPAGPSPGSLADLVDQAARAAQADAARAAAEAAAESGEDLRWALERHSLPTTTTTPGQEDGDGGEDGGIGSSPDASAAPPTITYRGFCAALAECPASAAAAGVEVSVTGGDDNDGSSLLPAAALFLRVERAAAGAETASAETAPTDVLADLLARRAAARQLRAELAAYDPRGTGWLSAAAVERWLADSAPLLPALEEEEGEKQEEGEEKEQATSLPDELYARVAARKIFLFHGERRRRRRRQGGCSRGGGGAFSSSDGGANAFAARAPSFSDAGGGSFAGAAAPWSSEQQAQQQLWVSAAELAASPLVLELLEARAWRGRLAALARWEGERRRAANEDDDENNSNHDAAENNDDDQEEEYRARLAAASDALVGNWFSRQSARRALATFASWRAPVDGGEGDNDDAPPSASFPPDGRGSLTLAQFSRIGGGGMSPLFLSRVFEVAVSSSSSPEEEHEKEDEKGDDKDKSAGGSGPPPPSRMDLRSFADFVLAWDNRHRSPRALAYLFELLDLRGAGELAPADLYVLFREVRALLLPMTAGEGGGGGGGGEQQDDDEGAAAAAAGVPSVRDVVAEVLDMAGPGGKVTRDTLWRSGLAGVVVGMLTSSDEFWAWNNREGS